MTEKEKDFAALELMARRLMLSGKRIHLLYAEVEENARVETEARLARIFSSIPNWKGELKCTN
jgi:hypothetical protein